MTLRPVVRFSMFAVVTGLSGVERERAPAIALVRNIWLRKVN